MESSRIKRRRLMVSITTPVSGADLPAIFDSLNDDTLGLVLKFLGDKSYRSFGGVNKRYRVERENREYEEACSVAVRRISKKYFLSLVQKALGKGVVFYNRRDVMDWALQEQNKGVLKKICEVAADEERTDLLDGVWNNVEDDEGKIMISRALYSPAARNGKLNILKWLETKGLFVNNDYCAKLSVRGGHIHILKWLKEERGMELFGDLYDKAIDGGHLHVMKWLREQSCPWAEWTFRKAAEEGNLDILHWLHDEGCIILF